MLDGVNAHHAKVQGWVDRVNNSILSNEDSSQYVGLDKVLPLLRAERLLSVAKKNLRNIRSAYFDGFNAFTRCDGSYTLQLVAISPSFVSFHLLFYIMESSAHYVVSVFATSCLLFATRNIHEYYHLSSFCTREQPRLLCAHLAPCWQFGSCIMNRTPKIDRLSA